MRAVLDIVIYALDLYKLVIVAGAVLSWLIAFGVGDSFPRSPTKARHSGRIHPADHELPR